MHKSRFNLLSTILSLLIVAILFCIYNSSQNIIKLFNPNSSKVKQNANENTREQHYVQSCLALYHKLRFPDMSLFFNPALKEPPANLLDEFTQHGEMPIKKWWYINDVYSDSKGDQSKVQRVIKQKEIGDLISRVKVYFFKLI